MNLIIKLYNICFDALLLGKQDSINQKRLLDDYCEINEHDVRQKSEYKSIDGTRVSYRLIVAALNFNSLKV